VDGEHISHRQLQALAAIDSTNSQNKAARVLGISVPVLHRYIKDLEHRLGYPLVSSNPRGTLLTEQGREILKIRMGHSNRLIERPMPAVACSPMFNPLVLKAVSTCERKGYKIDIIVADDNLNNRYLDMGIVDVVIFDDPIYIYRDRGHERYDIGEVVKDTLIHVYRGNSYLRYRYGAQRIGYSSLDLEKKDYNIIGVTRDHRYLLKSGQSFFINQGFARREGLELKSHAETQLFIHSVFALKKGEGEALDCLMNLLCPSWRTV
jgi:hypothetical protein